MNDNIEITINVKSSREVSPPAQYISTNGYLLLYLENDRVKTSGNIDLKALTPILTKIVLERMSK